MTVRIIKGDAREALGRLPDESVHCCVTSPPYWGLREYHGDSGMIGLEPTFEDHLDSLVSVFREVRRVLRKDGVVWMNYGDSYNSGTSAKQAGSPKTDVGYWSKASDIDVKRVNDTGTKVKDLMMMPSRAAIALQDDGWWLRSMLPWLKRNPTPESAPDRPHSAIEYVFLLSKGPKPFYDINAVRLSASAKSKAKRKDGLYKPAKGSEANDNRAGMSTKDVPLSRCFRNSDLFYQSIGSPHGLICDDEGMPVAVDTVTKGYSDAHFATFPPALIQPLIQFSTSEKGCCAECGAPIIRETGKTLVKHRPSAGHDPRSRGEDRLAEGSLPGQHHGWKGGNFRTDVKTTGWRRSCSCESGERAKPCTVLDPFAGAGTTGLVANNLCRDAVLTEISAEYAQMAHDRIHDSAPLTVEITIE